MSNMKKYGPEESVTPYICDFWTLKHVPNLKKVSIESLDGNADFEEFYEGTLDDKDCDMIADTMKQLKSIESLRISGMACSTESGLRKIIESIGSCKTLDHLEYRYMRLVDKETVVSFCKTLESLENLTRLDIVAVYNVETLMLLCDSIKKTNIKHLVFYKYCAKMSPSEEEYFVKMVQQMNLESCSTDISNDKYVQVLSALPKDHLDLGGDRLNAVLVNEYDVSSYTSFKHYGQLYSYDSCSKRLFESKVDSLLKKMPQLKKLDLSGVGNYSKTKVPLVFMKDLLESISSMKDLEYLNLSYHEFDEETLTAIYDTIKELPNIKEVKLTGCIPATLKDRFEPKDKAGIDGLVSMKQTGILSI